MREPMFDPPCRGFAIPSDDDRADRRASHQRDQQEPGFAEALVILGMRNRWQSAGEENRAQDKNRESADIEDSFDGPHGQLRGEGKSRLPRDEIRTNEFSGTTQQREASESDNGR